MDYPKYQPHPKREQRIQSAITAIKGVLPLDLLVSQKKGLLSHSIWNITEADGKKKVRYWSEGSIGADPKFLQHEHVIERRELIQRLLAGEPVKNVVADAVACMVTKEEHDKLGNSAGSGWERYVEAGIRVYDAHAGEWLSI